jgi:hypothetical protein
MNEEGKYGRCWKGRDEWLGRCERFSDGDALVGGAEGKNQMERMYNLALRFGLWAGFSRKCIDTE